jgi:hypothetical protein
MTATRRLRRLERQLRARALNADLHGHSIRTWIAVRDALRERGIEPPPTESAPGGWRPRR